MSGYILRRGPLLCKLPPSYRRLRNPLYFAASTSSWCCSAKLAGIAEKHRPDYRTRSASYSYRFSTRLMQSILQPSRFTA